jgi:N,N'-diacetyllegionaminate synthase
VSIFIIAEAGVNHNGSIEIAKRLIDAAAESGADAVKFQTFKTENLVTRTALKADYQKKASDADESHFDMLKRLELSEAEHSVLIEHCRKKGIMFLSTPFDHDSIDLLNRLGLEIFKISSGDLNNYPYLRHIGSLGKKIILSTGMAELKEIGDALNLLTKSGTPLVNITVLHATTEYPCPYTEVNLRAMKTIADTYGVKAGYSDHTKGIEVPVAAAALGASVIEKHFTLDCNMEGPDHKASLEPGELKAMVSAVRNIEAALGSAVKQPSPSESRNKSVARKSIVAAKDIAKDEIFTEEKITVKRPGTGINPMKWDEVIGSKAARAYKKNDLI